MKLTKYEHACFSVEKNGRLLIVDPGSMTHNLGSPENITAIVITHGHNDHFDVSAIGALIAHNPNATIYAHKDITRQFGDSGETLPYETINAGDVVSVGPFELEFFGGDHAIIHQTIPTISNLGIRVNNSLYYPGDSFFVPTGSIDTLALPVAAPWLKISEAIDFLMEAKPRMVFPTHDGILSDEGKSVVDSMLIEFSKKVDAQYKRLQEPIEL